ncbi:MAG TPA: NERD nuclease, partial [Nitrospira sp.]|nr:NERD nuclease [Nitrospira sp.]
RRVLFRSLNQKIYRRKPSFPIKPVEEFVLTKNCRNTRHIHSVVRPLFAGVDLDAPEIEGLPVKWHQRETRTQQVDTVRNLAVELLRDPALAAEQIVILVFNRALLTEFECALAGKKLPGARRFSTSPEPSKNTVRVLTAARFKGLECGIAIVVGLDGDKNAEYLANLYVAVSRPRNDLHLIADTPTATELRRLLG